MLSEKPEVPEVLVAMVSGTVDSIIDWEDGLDKVELPSAFLGQVTVSASSFGAYVTLGNGFAFLIEGLSPTSFTAGGDVIFV